MAKLLIVDDEKNIRSHLARFFREHGYEVQTAESGHQALAMFADHNADVVLTDYRMAKMNGDELLKHVKQRDPNVMVILMTAYATERSGFIETSFWEFCQRLGCLGQGSYDGNSTMQPTTST